MFLFFFRRINIFNHNCIDYVEDSTIERYRQDDSKSAFMIERINWKMQVL